MKNSLLTILLPLVTLGEKKGLPNKGVVMKRGNEERALPAEEGRKGAKHETKAVFSRLIGEDSLSTRSYPVLNACLFETKVGPMLAVADEKALYLLEFIDCRGLEKEVERLKKRLKCSIISRKTALLEAVEVDLTQYFETKVWDFKTPICLLGTDFQKRVWRELMKIPMGETCSYADLAAAIGRPSACRAVANANGANQLAILIPCHRVINTCGKLGGYGGGISRKQWLLDHEKRHGR